MGAARLNQAIDARLLRAELRAKTAEILHGVYEGAVKMVAANRPPFGVTRQRVERELSGDDANRLELFVQDLDRVVIEKGIDAVLPAVAFVCERYTSRSAGDVSPVRDAFARVVVEGGEAEAALITAMPDGLTDVERRNVLVELRQWRDRVDALIAAVERERFPEMPATPGGRIP